MPQKCCIPGCTSNYRGQEYTTVFTFPSNPDLKVKWLQSIPRKDYVVTKNSCVCAKHFHPQFILTEDCMRRDDGTLLCVPRSKPKLRSDAVPTIFLNLPSGLSPQVHKTRKASTERLEELDDNDSRVLQDRLIKDSVTSFQSFCSKIDGHVHYGFIAKSDPSAASYTTDKSGSPQSAEITDQGEAVYVAQKLEFLEQQRKFMHTFTDYYIDKMVREGKAWTESEIADRADFSDMCRNLDNAVEFLCLMCEELSSTVIADIRDETPAQPELCQTLPESSGVASGKLSQPSLTTVTSSTATASKWQTLIAGQAAGMYSCPHCSIVFSHRDVLTRHIERVHSADSKWNSSRLGAVSDELVEHDCKVISVKDCQKDVTDAKSGPTEEDSQERIEKISETKIEDEMSSHSEDFSEVVQKGDNVHEINAQLYGSELKNTTCNNKQLHMCTGEKPYKCDVCGIGFNTSHRLASHERKHKGEKPFQCDVCGAGFDRSRYLWAHKSKHTGVKPFHCEVCSTGFTLNSSLQAHMRKHTGEKPYVCDFCGVGFSDRRRLITHTILHTGEKPYKCDVCGAGFNRTYNLQIHKRKHSGEKPYKCGICDVGFILSSTLKLHERRHTGEKPYKCDVCGAGFTQNGGLQIHKRKHTGEKPFKCDICDAGFIQYTSLQIHIRKHTGEKPYKCDICGVGFSVNSSLQDHKRKHTREKPYLCDVCGTEFAHTSSLREHRRIHTGEKPYKCDDCSLDFVNSKKLRRHMKIHTGENP